MQYIDFELRAVILKQLPNTETLGYAIVFKTARERREFLERMQPSGRS